MEIEIQSQPFIKVIVDNNCSHLNVLTLIGIDPPPPPNRPLLFVFFHSIILISSVLIPVFLQFTVILYFLFYYLPHLMKFCWYAPVLSVPNQDRSGSIRKHVTCFIIYLKRALDLYHIFENLNYLKHRNRKQVGFLTSYFLSSHPKFHLFIYI